ncbi:MAG: hypothetical protein KAX78_07900 [Phycisphaerae bacterium]|nr:hypothetical protein [Phycisphaerae bacterium]
MEALKRTFFEAPLYLYVALAAAELVLFVVWRGRRTRKTAQRLLIPLALAASVFVLEASVVTLREKLSEAIEQLARHAEVLDVDAIAAYLTDDFELSGARGRIGRSAAVSSANSAIGRYKITAVKFVSHDMEMSDREARTVLTTQIITDADEIGMRNPFVSWSLHWSFGPQGWRIRRADQPQLQAFVPLR